MKRLAFLSVLLLSHPSYATTSTVNPNVPAAPYAYTGSCASGYTYKDGYCKADLDSSIIRNNFTATYNDINSLFSLTASNAATAAYGLTAYGWGNHAIAGYALSSSLGTAAYTATGAYDPAGAASAAAAASLPLHNKADAAINADTVTNGLYTTNIGSSVQAYNTTLAAVATGTYTGATSITTLGTVATGTWNGATIGTAYGGTGGTTFTKSGNTTLFVTSTGTKSTDDCAKWDASGNLVSAGAACGAGGGGSMVYPSVGIAYSTGTGWGTSYAAGTSANNLVQLTASGYLPALNGSLLTNVSGSMVYPAVGLAYSTGTGWGSSYAIGTAANNLVQLTASGYLPAVNGSLLTNINAATVTSGVYTTDTGSVTNTMLAGSIANNKLSNSSITIAGHSVALGGTQTIACGDLSNSTSACSTTVGTGASNLVQLDGSSKLPAVDGSALTNVVALNGLTTSNVAGTVGYIGAFTATNTIGNSLIYNTATGVGIGTAVPAQKLDVNGNINSNAAITGGALVVNAATVNSGSSIFAPTATSIGFGTQGKENLRVIGASDTNNYVLIQTSASGSAPIITADGASSTISLNLRPKGASSVNFQSTTGSFSNQIFSNTATGASLNLTHSRGSVGVNTIVQNADPYGIINFQGANGTSYDTAGTIRVIASATPDASSNMPGKMIFATTATSSATPTDRVIINSTGNVLINTTTDDGTTALQVNGNISATTFTGNVTGNVSGSSGSTTGNAATVTTNANLTGDVTSTGNATTLANSATGRANLGVAIGTNVQAYSATLVTYATDQRTFATSDTSATSSTSLAAITGLTATLTSGKSYVIEGRLIETEGAVGGGYKFDMAGGSATCSAVSIEMAGDNGVGTASTYATALNTVLIPVTSSSTDGLYFFQVYCICNGTGTFIPRFAQNASSSTSSIIRTGSRMNVIQIN